MCFTPMTESKSSGHTQPLPHQPQVTLQHHTLVRGTKRARLVDNLEGAHQKWDLEQEAGMGDRRGLEGSGHGRQISRAKEELGNSSEDWQMYMKSLKLGNRPPGDFN